MSQQTPIDLDDLLDSTVNIPTVPSTLLKLREICADENSNADDVAGVIEHDPAIAAKVLRLVNSSFYALSTPVNAINAACTILGQTVIKNIVVQATVLDALDCDGDSDFDVDALWDHSFKTAVATQQLVLASDLTIGLTRDDAYTCGLMHDVGKILIKQSAPEEFAAALAMSKQREIPLFEAEQEILGFTHAEAGALLAERWKLSDELRDAIRFHHTGGLESPAHVLGLFVHAANSLAHQVETARASWRPHLADDDVFEKLEVDAARLDDIRAAVTAAKLED
ncbi:MAG: HDOD domain-containing protein [Planctomycetes bacterium]|nr:HDOD domain-containing protein [Planctomycetota bacterium]